MESGEEMSCIIRTKFDKFDKLKISDKKNDDDVSEYVTLSVSAGFDIVVLNRSESLQACKHLITQFGFTEEELRNEL